MVTVDQGWLDAVTNLLGQAIGAVARLNNRIGGLKQERRCTTARFETGAMPADCPTTSN